GAVLSATDHRGISVTESVIHPCVRRVVEVLVVDDRGGPLLAVSRVALTARRDDDFSEALPMLALVAMVSLIAMVALVAMVPLVALRPIGAVLPVLSRGAVLSATDHRGKSGRASGRDRWVGLVGDVRVVDDVGGNLLAYTRAVVTVRQDD